MLSKWLRCGGNYGGVLPMVCECDSRPFAFHWLISHDAHNLLDALSLVSLNVELVGLECLSASESPSFFIRFYVTAFLPVIVVGMLLGCAGVIWAGLTLRARYLNNSTTAPTADTSVSLWLAVLKTLSQLVLVLYLPLSSAVFEYFDCIPSGLEDGSTVLASSPDVVCTSASTWSRNLVPAVLFVLLYPLGIPAAFVSILLYFRRSLDDLT